MAHIAIFVNLHTIIRAVRPFTCNVVRYAFGHLIIAPHYFQTLGWIGFIYGVLIGLGFSQYHSHSHPWPAGQGHGLGRLKLKFMIVKISFSNGSF